MSGRAMQPPAAPRALPRPLSFIQPSPGAAQRAAHSSMPPPVHYRPPSDTSSSSTSSRAQSISSAESGVDPFVVRRQGTATWDEIKTPKETWVSEPVIATSSSGPVTGGPGTRGLLGQLPANPKDDVESQFDILLEQLQIPATVRQKFSTVGRDVKSTLLLSSATNPAVLQAFGAGAPSPQVKKRMSTPLLRKAKSSSSIGSPGPSPQVGKTYRVDGDSFTIVASPKMMSPPAVPAHAVPGAHARGQSVDVPPRGRHQSKPSGSRPPASSRPNSFFGAPSTPKKGLGISMADSPEAMVQWLGMHKGTDLAMEVGTAKKLRMLLRHESTAWVAAFLDAGGYARVLDRLSDVLDVEWREEQHDDQMLYELLRCVKALSTSDIGKVALRASFPRPFTPLSKLLFSEKKPGDLACRQIIVELWISLFDLYPQPAALPGAAAARPTSVRFESSPQPITLTVRSLLVPEQDDPTKDHHEFITQSHRPRVFKAWVQELSDICRDYFWIMCHASNTLWALDEVDEAAVERPVAPGGATGGVEFEAMAYVSADKQTIHFRLLNTLVKQLADEDLAGARQLHADLLLSGMDRILVTMRKASTTYYPTLHLELARYVRLLQLASPAAKLPYLIDRLVGPPPEHVRKRGRQPSYLPPMPISTDGGRRGGWDMQL